jgi:hypothetical protein
MSIEITEVPNAEDGPFRRFVLNREEDVSGVSGTGVVAHGVQFPDGAVCVRWTAHDDERQHSSVNWSNIEAVQRIHGHDGRTTIEWVDDEAGLSESDHVVDDLLARALAASITSHTKKVLADLRELASKWRAQGAFDHSKEHMLHADQLLEILDQPLPGYDTDQEI